MGWEVEGSSEINADSEKEVLEQSYLPCGAQQGSHSSQVPHLSA